MQVAGLVQVASVNECVWIGFSSILVVEELVGLFVEEELVEELEIGFSSILVEELVEVSTGTEELSSEDELSLVELSSTVVETLSDELSVAEDVVSDDISAEVAELVLSIVVLLEQPASRKAATAIAINFFIVITSKCLIYFIISLFSRLVNNFLHSRSIYCIIFRFTILKHAKNAGIRKQSASTQAAGFAKQTAS